MAGLGANMKIAHSSNRLPVEDGAGRPGDDPAAVVGGVAHAGSGLTHLAAIGGSPKIR